MSLILFDQNTPGGLRSVLAAHEVRTALQMGWDALVNGALIAAAEAAGFDILVTADRNMRHQQNLSGRRLALVVLAACRSGVAGHSSGEGWCRDGLD